MLQELSTEFRAEESIHAMGKSFFNNGSGKTGPPGTSTQNGLKT